MIHIISKLPMFQLEMFHFSGIQSIDHLHSRFLCLLTGSLAITTSQHHYEMKKGDILFLPSKDTYTLDTPSSSLILYVCIHPYFLFHTLRESMNQIQHFYSDRQPDQKATMNLHMAGIISLLMNQNDTNACGIYAKAYELLYYISNYCMTSPEVVQESKVSKKLKLLQSFLSKHYMEPITLSDAAAALGYTPPYLSNFLKKNLNKTFQQYLNSFRLESAKILLTYTEEIPTKIALLCGFPNLNSFYHCFEKELGINVETYYMNNHISLHTSKTFKGIPVTNHSLILDYIFNYMNDKVLPATSHGAFLTEQATISQWSPTALEPAWNFIINMGTAKDFEKPTFRHHLVKLQEGIHFQYGRCVEIFTLVKIYSINHAKTYDFSSIFRLIDFMKSIHLKPFFDIDNKPFRLYKAPEHITLDYSTYLSTKDYDSFLFEILPEFIKACITRYGFDEFSTWKFELWRRYNINMSSVELPHDFCARFQKVARIFKTYVPTIALGGPGFNGFLDTENFAEILLAFSNATYQLDFVSAYYFPYQIIAGDNKSNPRGYTAAPTPYEMGHKIREWKTMLSSSGYEHIPFYLTEYSAHLSLENYLNDSIYPAVYIFHQHIHNYNLVDGFGYWLATDFSLDYGKPNAPLFGGNGLLTKNGIRKPAYYAHDFLNHLGPFVIARGEHYIVTTSQDHSIQILVYHFGILKQSFASDPKNQELLHYPYSAFEDSKPLNFQLTLNNIPNGMYRIKEWVLDLNHGNVLSVWGKLNHALNIGSEEIQYMDFQSVPSMDIHVEEIINTHLIHTLLNHNEARLTILQPYF